MTVNIVLDTNILVAGLRSNQGASFQLLSLLPTNQIQIHLSVPLYFEYEDVLHRHLDSSIFTATDIQQYLDYLCSIAILHPIYYLWRPFLRDPKDDMVLELAVAANCSYIITFNEKDFVGSDQFGTVPLRPKTFLQLLGVSK